MQRNIFTYLTGLCLSLVLVGAAQAASPQVVGDYTVHYSAFNTDVLQPNVAENYNIVRSKNRGLLTVSVFKNDLLPAGKAVHAKLTVTASNLSGQLRSFDVREVTEGNAIYYLSDFGVAHEEILDFTINVLPEGESQAFDVKFRQQFYAK